MKRLTICITALCLLMTSCLSDKVVTVEKTVVPYLSFPEFPRLKRTVNEDGSWIVPKESVDALTEYYIRIEETESNYKMLKELYEVGK